MVADVDILNVSAHTDDELAGALEVLKTEERATRRRVDACKTWLTHARPRSPRRYREGEKLPSRTCCPAEPGGG